MPVTFPICCCSVLADVVPGLRGLAYTDLLLPVVLQLPCWRGLAGQVLRLPEKIVLHLVCSLCGLVACRKGTLTFKVLLLLLVRRCFGCWLFERPNGHPVQKRNEEVEMQSYVQHLPPCTPFVHPLGVWGCCRAGTALVPPV